MFTAGWEVMCFALCGNMMPLLAHHFGGVVFPCWGDFENKEQYQYCVCRSVCVCVVSAIILEEKRT